MICKNCGKEIEESSKFCSECGMPSEEKQVEQNSDCTEINPTEDDNKKRISIKQIISVASTVITIIILFNIFFGSGGNVTEKYENDSGAVMSGTFEDFCEEFDSSYDDIEKSDKFDNIDFNLMECWIEPVEDTDESDIPCLYYGAELENIRIKATVYENRISTINFDFNLYDNNEIEFASTLTISAIMAGSGLNFDDSNDIFKTVAEHNVVIYKNGLLFYISDYGYFVIKAASESYVQAMNMRGIAVNEW